MDYLLFLHWDQELTLGYDITSTQSLLVDIPTAGYFGRDSFKYTACLDGDFSNQALVSINVEGMVKKQRLIMEEGSITLKDVKITDSDNGHVDTPLSISMSAPYSELQYDPLTISLASTRGLYFAEEGENRIGYKIVITTFNAYSDRSIRCNLYTVFYG
jgi:hypothetical protein